MTKNEMVFVTGVTGMLGSNLTRALLAEGYRVRGLARSAEKAARVLAGLDVEIVVGDMREVEGFAHALAGCSTVFHTAAYFREYYERGSHAEALESINIGGTLALMAAADVAGVAAFVHTSSGGTIGNKPDGSAGNEDTPPTELQLSNGYFRSKVEGDAKIRAFEPSSGMRIVEILPGWMWGPGDAGPTAAGAMVLDVIAGGVPAIPKGGTCTVDARDVAAAMVRAKDSAHGERYIVGGRYVSLRELVDAVADAGGVRAPRADLPKWLALTFSRLSELWAALTGAKKAKLPYEGVKIMTADHRIDSSKAERELGATFRPVAETARDTLAWYAAHGYLPANAALVAGAASA